MEGQMVSMTKMHVGYMWRLIRNVTEMYKLHVECHKKFEFEIH